MLYLLGGMVGTLFFSILPSTFILLLNETSVWPTTFNETHFQPIEYNSFNVKDNFLVKNQFYNIK